MNERLKRHIFEVIPLVLIGIALIVYFVCCAVYYVRTDAELEVLDGWERSTAVGADRYGTVLTKVLDDSFDEMRTICFYTVYADVAVRLDGKELSARHKEDADPFIRASSSGWNQAVIPNGSAGKVLEIALSTPYAQYADPDAEVRVGADAQINAYLMMKTVPKFVAALAILFIGVIFSIIAIFFRYHIEGNTGLYSLSLFIVVLAVFLASQQTYLLNSVYPTSPYIAIQCITFMLCPVLFTRYMFRTQTGARRRTAIVFHCISFANLATVLALHLLRVYELPEMMMSTQVLCVLILVYAFLLEISDHKRIIVLLSGALTAYALYRYYRTGTITWLVYPAIFVYIYIVVYRVINQVVRSKAQEIRLGAALDVSRSELATVQISSHFFYHTLDSIRALIRIDADKAYKMTGDFAKYLRYRVDGVERIEETVPFSRELRAIRAYTDIKQAQLGERFKMTYDVEAEDFEILPLTVQPLVENAVIHAVQKRRDGGEVTLRVRETQKGYLIEVIDNGAGANAAGAGEAARGNSVAINNVNTRLVYYGIAPVLLEKNDLGGMTASLLSPKQIARKEKRE